MPTPSKPRLPPDIQGSEPISLAERAEDNLRFIRSTMENAAVFTGLSGIGYVLTGITAVLAAWFAAQQQAPEIWFAIWMGELALATTLASSFTWFKTQQQGRTLRLITLKKLVSAFLPAMLAGALLSLVFYREQLITLLPGVWLSLYGAAVITAGAWSIRILPIMGAMFMVLGALALLSPISTDWLMAIGFGGLHIVFGIVIWRHYGG